MRPHLQSRLKHRGTRFGPAGCHWSAAPLPPPVHRPLPRLRPWPSGLAAAGPHGVPHHRHHGPRWHSSPPGRGTGGDAGGAVQLPAGKHFIGLWCPTAERRCTTVLMQKFLILWTYSVKFFRKNCFVTFHQYGNYFEQFLAQLFKQAELLGVLCCLHNFFSWFWGQHFASKVF